MPKINTFFSIVIFCLIPFIYVFVFYIYNLNENREFGFNQSDIDTTKVIIKSVLLGIFTILGIFAKLVYDALEKTSDENFNPLKVIQKAINSRYSWMAIIACPIVILTFYKNISTIDSYSLVCLLSFQNGFFFKSIFTQKEKNNK